MWPLLLALALAPTRDVTTRILSTPAGKAVEERGLVELPVGGSPVWKRFVLRYPVEVGAWNRKLLIGAHGGSGGEARTRDGRVIGTDETALDDVVGDPALANGFAYGSLDRDGIGGTRQGLELTKAFARSAAFRLRERFDVDPRTTYLAGLSMGGGIARFAAEEKPAHFDGILIIAGAHGDGMARFERQKRMAAKWTSIDPAKVSEPSESDLAAYAEAAGTPVEARRFWPFLPSSAGGQRSEPAELATGDLGVPTIEVVGTFDDFVRAEILAYEKKASPDLHRLYQVEGAWHISSDDDAISSFQYAGSRMGLAESVLDEMGSGASYLLAVRESLVLLDRWVSEGTAPPADRLLQETESLLK